jgi:hypothetical protein
MPENQSTQVPEEPVQTSTTPEVLDSQASAAAAAPATPQVDADVQALKQQLEKYELDIRKLKSTYDRKLTESDKQWQQKADELRRQAEEYRLATMDEDARGKYVAEKERMRLLELEEKASKATTIETDYQASLGAIQYFTSLGVPLSELVMDKGYDELFQSGFKFVTEEYKNLKTGTGTKPVLPPTAPSVTTTTGSTPNIKPTWADLVKAYGSVEAVYRGVESGRLSPDIIPLD